MEIFDRLFGKDSKDLHQKIWFPFLILEAGEKMPKNKWFQKETSKNKNFVNYRGNWSSDWKYTDEGSVKVAGISHGGRSIDFLQLAQSDDFKMYLEDDPKNPINKNAQKIMISSVVDDESATKHIGYLPDEIANKYAGIDLNISPKSVFLPTSGNLNIGVEVALLQRSARYLKKNNKGPQNATKSAYPEEPHNNDKIDPKKGEPYFFGQCTDCGAALKRGSDFCPSCGLFQLYGKNRNFPSECSDCGATLGNSEFCPKCGLIQFTNDEKIKLRSHEKRNFFTMIKDMFRMN